MFEDALDYFRNQIVQALEIKTQVLPDRRTLVVVGDTQQIIEPRAALFNDHVGDLESLYKWIARWEEAATVEVFVDNVGIGVFIDRDNPEPPKLFLNFRPSPAYEALTAWIESPQRQRDAVRMLRGPLSGCAPASLLNSLRAIEFKTEARTTSTVRPGQDSLGKSINREARFGDVGPLDDELAFVLPVFDLPGLASVQIAVSVDIDYEGERIALAPIGNAIKEAETITKSRLRSEIINSTGATVYLS